MKLKAKSRLQAALLNEQGKATKIVRGLEKKRGWVEGQVQGIEVGKRSRSKAKTMRTKIGWTEEDSDADPAEELLDLDAEEEDLEEESEDDEDDPFEPRNGQRRGDLRTRK